MKAILELAIIELNPKKLLNMKLICINGIYNTIISRKSTKLPILWLSKAPNHYKRNAIENFYLLTKLNILKLSFFR